MQMTMDRRQFRNDRDRSDFYERARKEFWTRKQAECARIEKLYGYV